MKTQQSEKRAPKARKWEHYFEIYDRHFSRFRGQAITLVEIGVGQGGSLELWRRYFGDQARIVGIDNRESCRIHADSGHEIFVGDQADRAFLNRVVSELGGIDIVIDDGGHRMRQQRISFEVLFPKLSPTGVYLCEDLHTSYWPRFGGGLRRPGTFIELMKEKIDELNAWHTRSEWLRASEFTESTRSMHFYDSVVVIEKGPHPKPRPISVSIPPNEEYATFAALRQDSPLLIDD